MSSSDERGFRPQESLDLTEIYKLSHGPRVGLWVPAGVGGAGARRTGWDLRPRIRVLLAPGGARGGAARGHFVLEGSDPRNR